MTELRDETLFEADHRPGAMKLSASRWPCLILPPDLRPGWMCSPYSYALHLTGQEPLPDGDEATLERGLMAEHIGVPLLAKHHGIEVVDRQARRERADIPAVCWLDGRIQGRPIAVEMKSMGEMVWRRDWQDGGEAPWQPRIQAQGQMTLDQTLEAVLLVPIVIGWSGNPRIPQIYEERRDAVIGNMLVETGRNFIAMLARGELPDPDETSSSYGALMRTLKLDPSETVVLDQERDAEQFGWWQQAKKQAKAGEEMCDSCRRYFSIRMGHAARADLPGAGHIERKQVQVAAEKQLRPARVDVRWSLRAGHGVAGEARHG
jgi:hypothetical protein